MTKAGFYRRFTPLAVFIMRPQSVANRRVGRMIVEEKFYEVNR